MPTFIIFIVSGIIHFFKFGYPSSVVFDEVYGGNFITHYWQGTYFFDVHPPLAKLILALFGYLIGLNKSNIDWSMIGNVLPPGAVFLRLIPIVAGIILPLVVYYICRRLNFSRLASTTAALLICFENSLVVQARFILFDVMMLLFGFAAILLYLEFNRHKDSRHRVWILCASIVCAAAALSIKWTGLSFILLIVLLELFRLIQIRKSAYISTHIVIKKILSFAFLYGAISLIIYMLLFGLHFALLPKSGMGDPFMSAGFQKTLIGNKYSDDSSVPSEGSFAKFIELNVSMFEADKTLTAPHQYSSTWNTWPLMLRPIFYWQSPDTAPGPQRARSYIYLIGNPLIYWLGDLSILALILWVLLLGVSKRLRLQSITPPSTSKSFALFFVLAGFLVNYIPFMFIGRVMFLYHYEAALVFSIFAIAYILDLMRPEKKRLAALILLTLAGGLFLFFSPLTYGTPLTDGELHVRMWLPSWR
jgi:dolichyl-phosphate-mannose-protein mannosyltransferase